MDLVISYRCDCKSGFTGIKCETGKINIPVMTLSVLNIINVQKSKTLNLSVFETK